MSKKKTSYACTECGASAAKWQGKCPQCGRWNTLVAYQQPSSRYPLGYQTPGGGRETGVRLLQDIPHDQTTRYTTHDRELDRVLGGGLAPGALVLVGGEPGIGKSTLMLQLVLSWAQPSLYISGEESAVQVRMRQQRMERSNEQTHILAQSDQTAIEQALEQVSPRLVVLDSIQTWFHEGMDGLPGSLNQIRSGATWMMHWAKQHAVPVFLIGHITKEGQVAGPKALEHIVDTVLYFEGDFHQEHRILRAVKNRFGPSAELGFYTMESQGLRPVENPSELLQGAHEGPEALSGIASVPVLEGQRPLLVEVQALMSRALFGTPQRTPTGFDLKRMAMLLAVLEKRCGLSVGAQDVFINVVGGLKIADPAADLAVLAAMASSFLDQALPLDTCFCGEVGLSGEVRPVAQASRRIQEALQRGMKRVYVSARTYRDMKQTDEAAILQGVTNVQQFIEFAFQGAL